MRLPKPQLIFLLVVVTTHAVIAQRNVGRKMPAHAVGLKLGDPFSITYKFYPNKKVAFVLDFGRSASGLYNRYFREEFQTYAETDTFSNSNASLNYLSHRVKSDYVGEFKLLRHFDAKEISPGLQAYAGIGWEWKTTRVEYDYLYNNGIDDPGLPDERSSFKRTRFTMGPQVTVGIEYSNARMPISAFMEVEYFTDILVDPGWKRFEGGIGFRYIF